MSVETCEKCERRPVYKTGDEGEALCAVCYWGSPAYAPRMRLIGRNEPRPCGSGKKFKKCCKTVEEAIQQSTK